MWDADFYVKVDDDVHVNIGKFKDHIANLVFFFFFLCIILNYISKKTTATLGNTLIRHRSKPRMYIGCMKSGPVLAQK